MRLVQVWGEFSERNLLATVVVERHGMVGGDAGDGDKCNRKQSKSIPEHVVCGKTRR